jgi:5-(aminomethyl)-3-furanmethanol phosphate kinase
MWILSLDGNLIGKSELTKWLDVVVRNGDGKVIIVPCGHFLASSVREAQSLTHVSEEIAHRMYVLSMDQYGLLMTGLNPALAVAKSELELAERGWQHRGIVWLPSRMVHADTEIPMNQNMTSDSLSAWLASKLEVQHVVIIKSFPILEKQASVGDLIQRGWVDAYLRDFMHAKNKTIAMKIWLLDKQYYYLFNESFDAGILNGYGLAVTE